LFRPEDIAQAIQETHLPGLNILPANAGLAAADVELVDKPGREQYLKKCWTA
jgi:chromosome partitioning protein